MKEFIDTWWHGGDLAIATDALSEALAPFGATVTEAELEEAMRAVAASLDAAGLPADDVEDDLRRHQIGWAARRANAALSAAGRVERVRAFARDADSDGSAWVVIEPAAYERCLSERGAPEPLERSWDDLAATPWIRSERRIRREQALSISTEALRANDFVLAEKAARIAHEGGDVLLGALALLEALAALGRQADAQRLWRATAERWLAGFSYPVLPGQWARLLALHLRLELPDDALVARCRQAR